MNNRWHSPAIIAVILVAPLLGGIGTLGRVADAQQSTPVGGLPVSTPFGAQPTAPAPGAQTWRVLVDNVSPDGENWSFNAFYPDHLQAHPGDTIVFTLAENPQAFHTVHILALGMTPLELYHGFLGGFIQPDLARPGRWQSTFFGNEADHPCGHAGQAACLFVDNPEDIAFGLNSGVLVNPPPGRGEGNSSFTVTLDAKLPLGPYYLMSDVDGPTMSGRIDVVAPDQPVQEPEALQAAAQRQYQSDLAWLSGRDRIAAPAEASNPDGTKTWRVDAGGGSPDKPWLSINAFAPSQMVILAGDTVTWTNHSPGAVPHTITGFARTPDALPQDLSPYQPGCLTTSGQLRLPPAGSFPPDIWNTCPGAEVNNLTEHSQPSAPPGSSYMTGERTSGILLNQDYLDSPIGDGLPYTSSYSATFPNPGTYYYQCAIHPGMIGVVVVLPKPMPR